MGISISKSYRAAVAVCGIPDLFHKSAPSRSEEYVIGRRLAYWLMRADGFSTTDIAGATGIPERTVKWNLAKMDPPSQKLVEGLARDLVRRYSGAVRGGSSQVSGATRCRVYHDLAIDKDAKIGTRKGSDSLIHGGQGNKRKGKKNGKAA